MVFTCLWPVIFYNLSVWISLNLYAVGSKKQSDYLRYVETPVQTNEACRLRFAGMTTLTENMLCAGRLTEDQRDACQVSRTTYRPNLCSLNMQVGVLGVRPPLFGDPQTSWRGKKTLRVCAQQRHVLVLNSYPDPPPPLSEILYPPLIWFTLA